MRAAFNIGRTIRPPVIPSVIIDFQNGVYEIDGVSHASFTAMGGTLNGGAAITGGSGLLCDASGESASLPYSFTGDCVIVADFVPPPDGVNRRVYKYADADDDPLLEVASVGGSIRARITNVSSSDLNMGSRLSVTKVANGYTLGGHRAAANGGATQSTVFGSSPAFVSGTLVIGNISISGTEQWGAFIRSVTLYRGSYIDNEITTLSA